MSNRALIVLYSLVGLAVLALVAFGITQIPSWYWHPLGYCPASLGAAAQQGCKGYNWHSGIEGNFPELLTLGGIITIVLGMWHHHNCHVRGCYRLSFHPHPDHGHPVCRTHYTDAGSDHPWLSKIEGDHKRRKAAGRKIASSSGKE